MIVSCKKIAKNKYIVKFDLTEKITFVLQLDYLLSAVIKIIKNRDFATTAAFILKNTLNIIFDNLNNIFIKKLFLKPSCELLIQDVIAGYKELERLIELQSIAKKGELSSGIRRIIAETDFKMLDGISISSYVFTSRFGAKNSFHFPETPSHSTKIYAIRINPRNSRNYYTSFDPDTLQGILQPNGLLDKSLEKAQKDSLNTLVEGNLARSWFSSLQAIANDKDKEHTLHLFNSPPEIITSLDILRASFEIEEILHRSGLKSPARNSNSLRRLLNLGGCTKSGLPINSYILPSAIGKSKSRIKKPIANHFLRYFK